MRPWYATHARDLLDSRKQGFRPNDAVIVSLVPSVPPVSVQQTVIFVRDDMPINRLDWRMLVDLEVWIWANKSVALETVLSVTHSIAKARPKTLFLRFEDTSEFVHDIDVGSGWHQERHEFLWWPQRTCCTEIAKRLTCALRRRQPERSYL